MAKPKEIQYKPHKENENLIINLIAKYGVQGRTIGKSQAVNILLNSIRMHGLKVHSSEDDHQSNIIKSLCDSFPNDQDLGRELRTFANGMI